MKILFAITNLYKETGGSYRAFIETVRAVYNKNVDIKIIYLRDELNKNNISIPETYKGIDIIHFFGGWDYFSIKLILYAFYKKIKVVISPLGTEEEAKSVVVALKAFTDVSQWHFVFAPKAEITAYYNQLKLVEKLDAYLGTPNVYILDKERNLRGRKDRNDYKEGYDTFHPSELSNEMLDDFKVILYEYRAALKKNNNASRKI
jgi:hypothetical protein